MTNHPQFGACGQDPGLEIWRIENFVPVAQAKETFGTFSQGDSYIVLQTKRLTSRTEWNLYFWLGSDSSQDERGAAALKTVELDDALGGGPVQYREVQGHESQGFMSLFKAGIKYQEGGVDSGFRKVDRDSFETRLLQLKGKRTVRITPVPVSHASLNSGDVFLCDAGLQIFQWNGKESSRAERAKGLQVCRAIRDDERGGRSKIFLLDEGDEGADADVFWGFMGGKGKIATAEEGGCDEVATKRAKTASTLHRISDASGELSSEVVGTGSLQRSMLDTNDTFVLDTGAELFLWIGKKATSDEKKAVWTYATKFLADNNYPDWTPVTRVMETGETPLFKQNFVAWDVPPTFKAAAEKKKPEAAKFDVASITKQVRPVEETMFDDASGTIDVWRIENMEPVSLPKNLHGNFYAGDSYLVMYESAAEKHVLYIWQGKDSSSDEKGAAALHAVKMDQDMGGEPVQVRIVQGKEPAHFLAIFNGSMIIHKGGAPSGFKNATEESEKFEEDMEGLFRIRGTSSKATCTIEVEPECASLNSNDCFIFQGADVQYVWNGIGASEEERTTTSAVSEILANGATVTSFDEGDETEEFWTALGGKGEYTNTPEARDSEAREPRLFQCTNASGSFNIEELFNFDQTDLDPNDVFFLDVHSELMVWVGSEARGDEKKESLEAAMEYIAASGREGTPVFMVSQANEPRSFTSNFVDWDPILAAGSEDEYARLKAELASSGATAAPAAVAVEKVLEDYNRIYSYAELLERPESCDKSMLETYLSEEEFLTVFKVKKADFAALPAWKRKSKKQAAKLF